MKISATKLRLNLYNLLDQVLKTGIPIEIERHGRILKIVPERHTSKLGNLEPHEIINGKPEDLVRGDWSREWDEGKNI